MSTKNDWGYSEIINLYMIHKYKRYRYVKLCHYKGMWEVYQEYLYNRIYGCFVWDKKIAWCAFIENGSIQEMYSMKTYIHTMDISEIGPKPTFLKPH